MCPTQVLGQSLYKKGPERRLQSALHIGEAEPLVFF